MQLADGSGLKSGDKRVGSGTAAGHMLGSRRGDVGVTVL